jgi:lysyl-tRNA synthetase class 2
MKKKTILLKRSQLLQQLRAFFYQREVIEVDTPMLSKAATPDPFLRSLSCDVQVPGNGRSQRFYLHTSPEYPMKRLLCEGVSDCFYLGKVFRDGDLSPRHQIEFSMLEWYRLEFSMQDLIDEVIELLQQVLANSGCAIENIEQLSYQKMFQDYAAIEDIFTATAQECREVLARNQVAEIVGVDPEDKALWEQLVLTEVIEPQLGQEKISVITHYPARDAALAQIDPDNPNQALRFEVFISAMELANGYQELAIGSEYQSRFEAANQQRAELGFDSMPIDKNLIMALKKCGLPNCSGVALGVDRLFALQQGFDNIEQGTCYGIEQA